MAKVKKSKEWAVQVGEPRPAAGDKPSAGPIYRNVIAKDGFPQLDGATTLYEVWERSVSKYADEQCLGWRPFKDGVAGDYEWLTYKQATEKVAAAASGLRSFGLTSQQRVGVFGANSPEWMVAMQACNRLSLECVPLYDSLGENAIEYIINHSESVAAFVSAAKLPALVKTLGRIKDTLKTIVVWGAADAKLVQAAKDAGFAVHTFDELLAIGAAKPSEAVPPKPSDVCTIMYTSGTTGDPKGVLLTHAAIVNTIATLVHYLGQVDMKWGPGDSILSYLPLAHIFDRTAEEMMLYMGCAVGYSQGDVLKLVDDIGALRPTMFIGVPRVFDRIYQRVISQINSASPVKKFLFNWAYNRKLTFMKAGRSHSEASPFFDKLVFDKIRQRLGGRVRLITSGGAPLAPHVEEFLRVAMCCSVVQGYGLTETCAASFISVPDDINMTGTVGPPLPCTEFRFESVPEMEYDALDATRPGGEVLIRSPGLFTGYYKAEDKTVEVMDADGWFHTGDIGITTKSGALQIVDRKKNIFKLSQGEYIAVEKLEATYKKSSVVEQVWVYGNSFKNAVVAVVVPAGPVLEAWAKANGLTGDINELVNNKKAEEYVLSELTATGKADKLKGFEIVKGVILSSEAFTIENEQLTPSFKLKRPQLQKKYQGKIDALYVALGDK